MEHVQIKWLGRGLLHQRHILARPLVGAVDGVSPPVRPVDGGLEDGDGKGVVEELMALEDGEGAGTIIQDGMDGVRPVRDRDRGTREKG